MKMNSKITGGARLLPYKEALKLSELGEFAASSLGNRAPEEYSRARSLSKDGYAIVVDRGKKASIQLEIGGVQPANFSGFFIFRKGSRATVSLKTSVSSDSSECRSLLLEQGSDVQFCSVQNNGKKAKAVAGMVARLGEDSQLKFLNSNIGGAEKRDSLLILQEGRGSRCEHYEVTLAASRQMFSKRSNHVHLAPETYSRSIFKYAAADFAQVEMEGMVAIEKSAPGSDTHLLAKSLLLSEKSVLKVKPMLSVRNSDVSAGHGSAIAPMQDEELFYLRSRGIGENESRLLVLQGFLQDLLVKSGMDEGLLAQLKAGLDAGARSIFPRD
jgi:Fe-S cluster assembly protein SufD